MLRFNNLIGFGARRAASGNAASAFDPAVKGTTATLSNGNRDLENSSSGWTTARGAGSRNSGLLYLEYKLITQVNNVDIIIGLCDSTTTGPADLNTFLGAFSSGFGVRNNSEYLDFTNTVFSRVSFPSTMNQVAGDVIQLGVNFDNGSVWLGRNNSWSGATPSTGTTGRWLSFTSGTALWPAASAQNTGNKVQLNTGTGNQTYSPPASYSAWG